MGTGVMAVVVRGIVGVLALGGRNIAQPYAGVLIRLLLDETRIEGQRPATEIFSTA